MTLPWFVLDEIIGYMQPLDLLELRLVSKYYNHLVLKKVFYQLVPESFSRNSDKSRLVAKYGHLCCSLFFEKNWDNNGWSFVLPKPELFKGFSEVSYLRFYSTDDDTLLKICTHLPKLQSLSLYCSSGDQELTNLSHLVALTSLTICFNVFSGFGLQPGELPNLRKLVMTVDHLIVPSLEKSLKGKLPPVAYFHLLKRHKDIDYSLFEVDITKRKVLAIGVYYQIEKQILSFRFTEGYYIGLPVSGLDLETLAKHYEETTQVMDTFLVSASKKSLFKHFTFCSHNWNPEKNPTVVLPRVDTIVINISDLNEIRMPRGMYTTTNVTVREYTQTGPEFVQWLLDYFTDMRVLDFYGSLGNFSWYGYFSSLETLKTPECTFATLLRVIAAAPNLKYIYASLDKETLFYLQEEYPRIIVRPYTDDGQTEQLFDVRNNHAIRL